MDIFNRLFVHCRKKNYNGCRTNAAAEASYDRARSIALCGYTSQHAWTVSRKYFEHRRPHRQRNGFTELSTVLFTFPLVFIPLTLDNTLGQWSATASTTIILKQCIDYTSIILNIVTFLGYILMVKVTNLLVYRYVQTSLVTAATWGDPTQVAAGYIALLGSKSPAPPERPQNFDELAQREKELTAMAGGSPDGIVWRKFNKKLARLLFDFRVKLRVFSTQRTMSVNNKFRRSHSVDNSYSLIPKSNRRLY